MKLNGSVAKAGFINDLADRTADLASFGYFPGTFGSVSVVLDSSKVSPYFVDEFNDVYHPFPKPLKALSNRFVLLTTHNLALRSISVSRSSTHKILGIIRVTPNGEGFQLMWGFYQKKLDEAEIYRQLIGHNEAMLRDAGQLVVVYTSPSYLQQYSFYAKADDVDDFKFTKDLWTSFPQLSKLTPNGIGVVDQLGISREAFLKQLVKKLGKYNALVVKTQGVILTGSSWDDILGLATSLDRAAQAALTIGDRKGLVSTSHFKNIAADPNQLDPQLVQWLENHEK